MLGGEQLQAGVPPREKIDRDTRERLRKWLHYLKERGGHGTNESFANQLGLAEETVTTYLNGTRSMGFDVFIKVHRVCRIESDRLLEGDPPPLASGKPYPPPRIPKSPAPPAPIKRPFVGAPHTGHGGRRGQKKGRDDPGT